MKSKEFGCPGDRPSHPPPLISPMQSLLESANIELTKNLIVEIFIHFSRRLLVTYPEIGDSSFWCALWTFKQLLINL